MSAIAPYLNHLELKNYSPGKLNSAISGTLYLRWFLGTKGLIHLPLFLHLLPLLFPTLQDLHTKQHAAWDPF